MENITFLHYTLTMISIELQRDVPQYMAIPWLITWVMARTVSDNHNMNSDNWSTHKHRRDEWTKANTAGKERGKAWASKGWGEKRNFYQTKENIKLLFWLLFILRKEWCYIGYKYNISVWKRVWLSNPKSYDCNYSLHNI